MAKLNSINPANGKVVGSVKVSTKNEVANAFKKAKKIFPVWSRTPIEKRIEYIDKFAREIEKQKKELAKIITLEMGKPLKEALNEVTGCQEDLWYYIKKGPKILKDYNPPTTSSHSSLRSEWAPEILFKKNKEERKVVFEPWASLE